jgi:nucleotide-binding universal stress UspA family protein
MYRQIMVPVDLSHVEDLGKALATAADLAKHNQCPVCYVAVTMSAPNSVAANPETFAEKLEAFAQEQGRRHGHAASSKTLVSHDPAVDLDGNLMRAIDDVGADLVVMQSHVPRLTDYVWPSNGGTIASHSKASVFVVR